MNIFYFLGLLLSYHKLLPSARAVFLNSTEVHTVWLRGFSSEHSPILWDLLLQLQLLGRMPDINTQMQGLLLVVLLF